MKTKPTKQQWIDASPEGQLQRHESRLSSLEERVKKLEKPPLQSGYAEFIPLTCAECGQPIQPMATKEDIREKIEEVLWDAHIGTEKKIFDLTDKILAIVKEGV